MKLIKIIILFVLIILLMYAFLNYHFVPIKGKKILKNRLEEILDREVNINKASYSLREGIVLEGVSIKAKENSHVENLITAEKISFDVLLLPLIQRKIIIAQLNIDKPIVAIIKGKNKELNIEDLIKTKESKPQGKKFDTLIVNLEISNGQFEFYDYSLKTPSQEILTNVFINYNYSLPLKAKIKASANIKKENASIQCAGNYNPRTKKASLEGKIEDLRLSRLAPFINLPIDIKEFEGALSTEFKSTIDSSRILTFKGKSQIEAFTLKTQTLDVIGNLKVASNIKYDLLKKKVLKIDGDVNFERILIGGVPYVQNITDLEGRVIFNREEIVFRDLKGNILTSPTTLEGTIDLQNLLLNLVVRSKLNLDKFLEILPIEQKERFEDVKIKGQSYITLNLKGDIRKLISLDITGDISFSDILIESPKSHIKVKKISGKINLSKDKAEMSDLKVDFKGIPYMISGTLTDYKQPQIELKIISDNLFCAAKLNLVDKMIQIEKIKGNYFGSEFEVTGEIINLESPDFNIYADLILDLSDIQNFFPQKANQLSKLELKGKCPGSLHFEGKLYQWRKALAGFKISAKRVYLKRLKLNNFYVNATMRNQKILINNFSFDLYDGNLNLASEINLQKEAFSYSINTLIKEVNLAKLVKDTELKNKEISGKLFLRLDLTSPLLKDMTGPSGKGSFLIIDGHLLELPLLNTLAETIKIPVFEKITFKEARADFLIRNRTISTNNLTLESDKLTLKLKGNIDFQGNIDFLTNAELSKQTYEGLGQSGQIASLFFDVLGRYLLRVKSTGTISNPQHKLVTVSSEDVIEGLKGLGEILKGL